MEQRTFDELISHFNSTISKWEIDQKYKFELLGMITSIGYAHEKMLKNLPSAEPKTGKWIKIKNHHYGTYHDFDYYTIRCSVCGDRPEKAWHLTPFCPNCGSRMLEEGGEDD